MRKLICIGIVSLFISCSDDPIEPTEPNLFVAPTIERTTQSIFLEDEMTLDFGSESFQLEFYRNEAYKPGTGIGNYTFMLVNSNNIQNEPAPLWIYLHGGGMGYYDEQGMYHGNRAVSPEKYNNEQSFEDLLNHVQVRVLNDGQLVDQTLKRRIEEGYRLLVVSYCDHDWYSGIGTHYPNFPSNPNAQVNGLQATMSAIDYTIANYPTTYAWAQGTSAGSVGVWSLAMSYVGEDHPLTGFIADSGFLGPNFITVQDVYLDQDLLQLSAGWERQGATNKIGFYADLDNLAYPEAQIEIYDFRMTPGFWVVGNVDDAFVGHLDPIDEATAVGFFTNPEYISDGLNTAINNQTNSLHELHLLPNTGHVPTHFEGPVNDLVDNFIDKVLATNPPPFGM